MSRSNIGQWLQRWFSARLRVRRPARSLRRWLFLEPLEDRWLPSTIMWGSDTPGDWDTPGNWAGGAVPTAADDAVIPFNNIIVTHSTNAADAVNSVNNLASFSLSGGSLSITTTGQFTNAFTLTGASSATLSGAGTITLSGPTTWNGFSTTMSGPGVTNLMGNSTITGNNLTLDTHTLNNFGTVSQGNRLVVANGAVINNEVGATWNLNLQASGGTAMFSGSGAFNNFGTLTSSDSLGSLGIGGIDFLNSGNINVSSGELSLFNTSDTFTNGATVSGPGLFDLGSGGTAPALTLIGSSTIGSGSFTLFGFATMTGSGTTTVTGDFTWFGTMSGNGTTLLLGNSTVGNVTLNTRTLDNLGIVTQNGGIVLSNAAVVNNETGGSWTHVAINATVDDFSGSGTFNNAGAFHETGASGGDDHIGVPIDNTGTLDVQSARLTFDAGGTDSGSDTVGNGTAIEFNNATYNFTAASSLTGLGGIDFKSGTLNVAGGFTPTGSIFIEGGTANFMNTVNGTGSVTFTSLSLSGFATLTGASTITVTGATTWNNATMSGTGVTNLRGTSTLSGSNTLDTRTLNNFGALSDNAAPLQLNNGAVINNESGATWLLVATNATVFSGTGTFNNAGMFNMSGAGTDSIAIPFNSSGTVHVTSGGLTVLGDGIESGTINIDSSTTMTFSAGSDTFTNGAVVQGAGTFVVSGAETITALGNVSFGSANFTFDGSMLTGSGTVTVTGATTWTDGTMSGTGETDLFGSTTIATSGGSGNTLDTRTLINFGTVTQAATLTLSNGAVIDDEIPQGSASFPLWNLQNGSSLLGGSNDAFTNAGGTFESSGPAGTTSDVSITFSTSGFVEVQSGTLSFDEGGDDISTNTVATGATLRFNGGTFNLQVISFVDGGGNITFNGGTVNVAGSFTPTGLISVMGNATANFTNTVNDTGSVSFTTLSLTSSGTLTGDATITVTGAATWSGGTMSGNGITAFQGATALSGNDTLDVRTLNNFGMVSDTTSAFLDNGAIDNDPGAVWNLQSNAGFTGSGLFANLGTLNTAGPTNTIAVPFFDNIGVVNVQSGTLTVLGDGIDSGTITIAGGTSMTFSAGSDTFTAGALVNGAGTFVVSGNETLTVTGNVNFGSSNFTFDSSTLTGSGTLTVTSATTWNNGTMSGTGVTNLLGNTTIGSGTSGTLSGRTLNNAATVTVLGGLLDFGAVINNQSGAVWDLQNNASFGGQNATFNNAGTLQMSSGTNSDFDATLNSSGLVDGRSGTLDLLGGGTETGTFTAENGTTLEFGGGTYNFNAGSAVTGAGSLLFSFGTVANIGGGFTSTGSVTLLNGTANFTNTVNGSGSATLTSLSIGMGTLTGAATVTVTGTTSWDTGTMSGTGVTNLDGSSTFAVSGSLGDTLDTRTLNNFGNLLTTNVSIPIINGAVLNNESGAVWNMQTTDLETGTVNNLGTLNVSGGFHLLSGQFPRASVDNAGTVTVASNSTFTFGTYTQTAGTLKGGGVLNGDVVINGGVVSPGFSPGILTIQGNYTQNGNSALNVEIDGATAGSQFSVLAVSGTATLDGTLNLARTTGFAPAFGQTFQIVTASAVSGTFATVNGLQINGSESFTVTYNATNVVLGVGTQRSLPPDQLAIVTPAADGTATWTLYNDFIGTSAVTTFTFGLATDIPLVGDWNGSGFDSVGVVRPTAGGIAQWSLDTNGDHAFDAGDSVDLFGLNTDIAVVGDWTGSGTTKIGVVRALPDGAAQWSLDSQGTGSFDSSDEVTVYGLATDQFGAGHWTGPGKDELAVVRPGPGGTAQWILNTTGTGVYSPSDTIYTFGYATDTFIVGDWNGDGRTKIGVERPGPNGTAVVTLDTNGDGVYDAGDQVIILPASVVGTFEFGNWKTLAKLSVPDPPNTSLPPLALDATFQADVNLAINEWAQAGLNGAGLAQLRGLTYSVSTLGGGTTALTDGNHIVLDATAAGNGWSEGPVPQPGQIDLVTALAHEMGHALGLGHSTDPNDVMFATLPTGMRRMPTAADVNELGTVPAATSG